jgi:hypothetical protein
MNRSKNVPHGTNVIVIPELEEAAARYRPHKFSWSDRDIAILKKYYGRVPVQSLESTLHRQTTKIHEKAIELGTERGMPFEGET